MIPEKFGRYVVLEEIGRGASGVVFKGKDPLIERIVAIKTIHYKQFHTGEKAEKFLQRFYREAQASGVLSHPNIVTIFDIGEEAEIPYIAMEFIEGMTLSQYMKKSSVLKERKIIPILKKVASALDYAHSQGIIHRDVKPSNVMYSPGDVVKVMDFSIARLDMPDLQTITTSGTVLGTPYYMPPEQILGEKVTTASDTFSVAVMAYEMMTGALPFPGSSLASIMYKVLNEEPVKHGKLAILQRKPDAWEQVFQKGLNKNPTKRFQSVRELVAALGLYYNIGEKEREQEKKPVRKKNYADFVDQKTVLLNQTPTPSSRKIEKKRHSMNLEIERVEPVTKQKIATPANKKSRKVKAQKVSFAYSDESHRGSSFLRKMYTLFMITAIGTLSLTLIILLLYVFSPHLLPEIIMDAINNLITNVR